ncbi:MAG: flagellar basal-body rod protein FlgG [bacterium]|nr:flagellar basal-body rod protein FlgG [bacterium]
MSFQALNTVTTGMLGEETRLNIKSNDIANANTTGYKQRRAHFQDLIYQDQGTAGTPTSASGTAAPTGSYIGVGVKLAGISTLDTQGDLKKTSNPYDFAIGGNGRFQVQLPTGEMAYTRAGDFQKSSDGTLVTMDGYTVQPGITIPPDALTVRVNDEGEVYAKIDGQEDLQLLGQFELAHFNNTAGLESIGKNLSIATSASGAPIVGTPSSTGFGTIQQEFLEASNVNSVEAMMDIIMIHRGYELGAKVGKTADQMMAEVNNI